MKTDEILFELIKFDMEQIRLYGQAVLYISSTSILAAFAISAFVYGMKELSVINGKAILISTHISIFAILAISLCFYGSSIDASRSTLEMRECALKTKVDNNGEMKFDATELYPWKGLLSDEHYPQSVKMYGKCKLEAEPHMKSNQEKYPLLLAMIFVFLKLIAEVWWLPRVRATSDSGGK